MKDKFAHAVPSGKALTEKICVIIPYAGFNPEKTGEREKQGPIEFGFKSENIHVANELGIIGYKFPYYICSRSRSFGRKVFDELQLGTDFVSRQFVNHAGNVTQEHKDSAKVKSSATTQLVSQIILSDGRTISYEYDAEERITKVTDSMDGTTEYTYDALGQLLTETVNGELVNCMEYVNYGNILKKKAKYTPAATVHGKTF